MDEKPTVTRVWPAVVLALMLPVAYLLSTGPVWQLAYNGTISQDAYWVYAGPAWLLGDYCPTFSSAMWRYLNWWGPLITETGSNWDRDR